MSLKRDTFYNLIGNALPLLAAALTIPYVLRTIGNEGFGVLTLIWGMIGYFGLFDFGVGRALTYEVGRRVQDDKPDSISKVIKAGLIITFITGLLGVFVVEFLVAPFSAELFKISIAERVDARLAFEVAAYGIIPTTVTSGMRGALEGLGRFAESNVNRAVVGALMFLTPVGVIHFVGSDLQSIALGLVVARFVVCFLSIFQLRTHLLRNESVGLKDLSPLLNFGVWVTVSGLISPLMVFGDRFFISSVIGAQDLSFYAIPQEGLQRLLIIPTALATALLPRMAAVADGYKLTEIYLQNIKRIAFVMFVVLAVAVVFAGPVLSLWISKDFAEKSRLIVFILSIGLWFNSLAQMPMTLLHSVGKPKLAAIAHVFELPLYIGAIVALSMKFGISGAALAWTLRAVLDFFLFNYFARSCLKKKV